MLVNVDINHIVSPNYWFNGSYTTSRLSPSDSCRKHASRASSRRCSLNRRVTRQRVCDECLNLVNCVVARLKFKRRQILLPLDFLFSLFSPFPLYRPPCLPCLTNRPPKIKLEAWGSAVSFPSGVWGGPPAENEFDAFQP